MNCGAEVLELLKPCESAVQVTKVPKLPNEIIMHIIKLAWGTTLEYHTRPVPKEYMHMVQGLQIDLGRYTLQKRKMPFFLN